MIGQLAEEAQHTRSLSEGIYYYLASGMGDRQWVPVISEFDGQAATIAMQSQRPGRRTEQGLGLQLLHRFGHEPRFNDLLISPDESPSQNGGAVDGSNEAVSNSSARSQEIEDQPTSLSSRGGDLPQTSRSERVERQTEPWSNPLV